MLPPEPPHLFAIEDFLERFLIGIPNTQNTFIIHATGNHGAIPKDLKIAAPWSGPPLYFYE